MLLLMCDIFKEEHDKQHFKLTFNTGIKMHLFTVFQEKKTLIKNVFHKWDTVW